MSASHRFAFSRNGRFDPFAAPRRPRHRILRVVLGLAGVGLLLALLFVSVFVGIAMLAAGMLWRLWARRGRPLARTTGETAALIMIGAFAFIAFDNKSVNEDFTTVAIQIYNWTTRPQEAFRANASAGIIVLMVMVIGLNLVAVLIRERFRRK